MGAFPSRAAGWYPDPSKRFELRYFDGVNWTLDVRTGEVTSKDLAGASTVLADPADAPVTPGFAGAATPAGVPGATNPNGPPGPPWPTAPLGQPAVAAPVTPGVLGSRARVPVKVVRREVAPVGPGLFIGLAGLVALSVGALTDSSPLSELGVYSGGFLVIAWYAFVVVCTTLRYQPKAVGGFFLFGFIGLFLFREEPDADSKRANVVAVIAVLLNIVWPYVGMVPDTTSYKLILGGKLLVLLGAIVGRRVIKTEVYL